jgi:hypothetical protein
MLISKKCDQGTTYIAEMYEKSIYKKLLEVSRY